MKAGIVFLTSWGSTLLPPVSADRNPVLTVNDIVVCFTDLFVEMCSSWETSWNSGWFTPSADFTETCRLVCYIPDVCVVWLSVTVLYLWFFFGQRLEPQRNHILNAACCSGSLCVLQRLTYTNICLYFLKTIWRYLCSRQLSWRSGNIGWSSIFHVCPRQPLNLCVSLS